MKKGLMFILLVFFTTAAALAQTAPPPPQAPAEPLDLSREGLRRWELKVADNAFFFDPSEKNRAAVLHSLERHAELTCFKKLPYDLKYTLKEISEECDKLVDRLFELDSTNPVATCIRDSFTAVSCQDAFSNQIVLSREFADKPMYFQNTYGIFPLEALSDDKESQTLASSVSENCSKAVTSLRVKISEEDRMTDSILKGGSIFQQLAEQPVPTQIPDEKDDTMLKSFGGSAQDKQELKPMERIRILSSDCLSAITRLENIAPFHSFVPCYRGGFYTPNCANQKRKRKKERTEYLKKKAKKKSKKKKKKNSVTF